MYVSVPGILAHRLHCVEDDVEKYLFELLGIRLQGGILMEIFKFHLDLLLLQRIMDE